jgi:hypothetical protein
VPFVVRRPDAVAGIGAGIMGAGVLLVLALSIMCGGGGGSGATPIAVTPATAVPTGGKVGLRRKALRCLPARCLLLPPGVQGGGALRGPDPPGRRRQAVTAPGRRRQVETVRRCTGRL